MLTMLTHNTNDPDTTIPRVIGTSPGTLDACATQREIERFAAERAFRVDELPTGLHGIITAYQHQIYALTGRRPDVLDAVLALSAARDRREGPS